MIGLLYEPVCDAPPASDKRSSVDEGTVNKDILKKLQISDQLTTSAPPSIASNRRSISYADSVLLRNTGRDSTYINRQERRPLLSRTITAFSTTYDDKGDQPLDHLLRAFGDIVPEPRSEIVEETRFGASRESDWIICDFVCYSTLRRVIGVDIEWVDIISLHLEFDNRKRTLKVFRFPSFCRMMCQYQEATLLSR